MPAGAVVPIPCDVPPYRLSGAVYGALLNHRSALALLGQAVHAPPYRAPPQAPVLCVKPRNTLAGPDTVVRIPADAEEVEVGANVGLVIGRAACRVPESRALDFVAGYLIVADVSLPLASHFRPGVRLKARDGFCPLGPAVADPHGIDSDALTVEVFLDGARVQSATTTDLIRPTARLLADVTEFMTLSAGDVLALGAAAPAPRARPGQILRIEVPGIGVLSCRFEREAA
ncbi:MAG TPA: fumarylacetoacetate hydrolase family protein [Steroidobacteraceae bacterium]|nr:fumarylacetoacetate hydrolase family protein [Steroidobacteraceae bacterium]